MTCAQAWVALVATVVLTLHSGAQGNPGTYVEYYEPIDDNFYGGNDINSQPACNCGLGNNVLEKCSVDELPENLQILSCTGLSRFPVVQGLDTLTSLSLFQGNVTVVPEFSVALQNLKTLRIVNNQITSIPESIGNLKSLSELTLQNNQIASLPKNLSRLAKLTSLNVEENSLSDLLPEFGALDSLRLLYLRGNQITKLPDSFGDLKYLQELHIEDNNISSLPESIGESQSLQFLNLAKNKLTSLPTSIGALSELKWLHLSRNEGLTSLPESIGKLGSLENLFLDGLRGLSTLPVSTKDLGSLNYLDLSRTGVQTLPSSMATLPNPRKLSIKSKLLCGSQPTFYEFGSDYSDVPKEGISRTCSLEEIMNLSSKTVAALASPAAPGLCFCDGVPCQLSALPRKTSELACPDLGDAINLTFPDTFLQQLQVLIIYKNTSDTQVPTLIHANNFDQTIQLKAPNSLSNIVEIAEALSTATPTEHTHLKTPFSGLEEGRHVVTLVDSNKKAVCKIPLQVNEKGLYFRFPAMCFQSSNRMTYVHGLFGLFVTAVGSAFLLRKGKAHTTQVQASLPLAKAMIV